MVSGQSGLGWSERWNLYQKPDLFVALSRRNADWVRSLFPNQRIEIIPNGVDLTRFSTDSKLTLSSDDQKILSALPKSVIVCVAGPERFKQVGETIRAVAALPQSEFGAIGWEFKNSKTRSTAA